MNEVRAGNPSATQRDLVLASTSVYRRELLERLGVPFRCRAPDCDEAELMRERVGMEPRRLAAELAEAKAASSARSDPGAIVIGCDQMVSFEGRIFGKPLTVAGAIEQLSLMSGRTHELITALVVIAGSQVMQHTDVTRLTMRALTREGIERYVHADEPWDCAGSYKLESRGVNLFERIESADQTAITGLPLIALCGILIDLGYQIP